MLRKKEKVQMQGKRKGFSLVKLLFSLILFSNINLSSYFYTHIASAQEINVKQGQDPENKELTVLEEKVFHQNYITESKEARISRLESFLFGKQSQKESSENRIKKITSALKTPEPEEPTVREDLKPIPEIKSESLNKLSPPQEPIDKEGVIGAINQIEIKMFNMTFNDYPFQARINALEDRILSKREITNNRLKPLLERVTILVDKADIPVQKDTKLNLPAAENINPQNSTFRTPPSASNPKSYSIDLNSGFLIDDKTGQIVKDSDGNPISIMLPQPQQLQPNQNYGYMPPQNPLQNNPYGNNIQQNPGGIPSPYDFLFNQQNNLDPGGSDPGY